MSDDTTWEYWGQQLTWLTRAGDVKNLHGQAFFPRTSVPPDLGIADHLDYPDVSADAPPVDDVKAYYILGHAFTTVAAHFTGAYNGDTYTGMSIFQINPRARGKPWAIKHTRLAHAHKELEILGEGWGDYPAFLTWSVAALDELRVFVRIFNRTAFLNFGPITAEAYP